MEYDENTRLVIRCPKCKWNVWKREGQDGLCDNCGWIGDSKVIIGTATILGYLEEEFCCQCEKCKEYRSLHPRGTEEI
jgi:hypothetical protein